jgi:exosome complex RNA-binding protein Rrp4
MLCCAGIPRRNPLFDQSSRVTAGRDIVSVRRSRGGRHYVDNSEIKECDAAVGDNGVVHVVDRVLLPENLLRSTDGIEERVSSVDGLTKIFSSLLNGNQFNQQNFF